MLSRTLEAWPEGRSLVDMACEVLGRDLLKATDVEDPQVRNRDVQVLVFLTSHLHLMALAEHGYATPYSLGLSLGEYNHLVHIGALEFADALKLVDYRGQCYEASPKGKMVAVMPLEREELAQYVSQVAQKGRLEIANYNSPTQHVVAGECGLVDELVELVEEEAMAMCFPVDRSIPMHTHIMDPVAEKYAAALVDAPWQSPVYVYRPGVAPDTEINDPAKIPEMLARHVNRPVYFYDSLIRLLDSVSRPVLVEVGPEKTLSNMIKRFIDDQVLHTDFPDDGMAQFVLDIQNR